MFVYICPIVSAELVERLSFLLWTPFLKISCPYLYGFIPGLYSLQFTCVSIPLQIAHCHEYCRFMVNLKMVVISSILSSFKNYCVYFIHLSSHINFISILSKSIFKNPAEILIIIPLNILLSLHEYNMPLHLGRLWFLLSTVFSF